MIMMRKEWVVLCLLVHICLGDYLVYDGTTGELVNEFQSWSWATVNLQDTTVVAPGDKFSISVVIQQYQALYLHTTTGLPVSTFSSLNFKINGGQQGSQPVVIKVVSYGNQTGSAVDIAKVIGAPIPANKWVQVSVPLSSFSLDAGEVIDGFWWQANSNDLSGSIYLDDITLVFGPPVVPTGVTITLDTSSSIPVSDLIFGVNWANSTQLEQNKYTVNRWGGEGVTRYAYDVDAANHASDWYFEDLPNANPHPAILPDNSSCDVFVATSFAYSAIPVITVPLIGFTPIDRQVRCGFSIKKYGPQAAHDPYQPDCGNGIKTDGKTPITGNDPADTSRVINETFVVSWLNHLNTFFKKGQVNFFELDNEPGLWNTIHRDVHPNPVTYDELWNRTVTYASAIKKNFPNSVIFGPIPWGWCEYMFSPADNCADGPDRKSHGDLPLLAWYIQQLGLYKQKYGVQLVDVIDVHIYPQGENVWSSAEDPITAALRLRSTRALWDPSYVDESWINQPIYLIPRVQQWINQYNPGLKIAVSEYNWGTDNIITGALAQVMILGIFARNQVYLATRWVTPDLNTKVEESFRIFTNYDGEGSKVQGSSISATSNNTAEAEAYAFVNQAQLFVVIVNKINATLPITVTAPSLKSGSASLFSFSATRSLGPSGSATISNSQFQISAAAYSATLAVIN